MKPADTSARLIVDLPEGARMYVDGKLMQSDGEIRHFFTPALQSGVTYFYDVRVELDQDGETLRESKQVYVKAGEVVRESFTAIAKRGTVAARK